MQDQICLVNFQIDISEYNKIQACLDKKVSKNLLLKMIKILEIDIDLLKNC